MDVNRDGPTSRIIGQAVEAVLQVTKMKHSKTASHRKTWYAYMKILNSEFLVYVWTEHMWSCDTYVWLVDLQKSSANSISNTGEIDHG